MYLWDQNAQNGAHKQISQHEICKHIPPNVGEVDEDKAGCVVSGVKISQEYNYINV